MHDQARIKSELIEENALSKQKIQDLEQSELERKQAEEALRDSKEQYQFVVENLKEVVFRTDAEGHWTFLNSAWAEVTGFAVEESLGMVFLEYVYPEDRQLNLELFRPLIERKKDYCRHEIRYMNKNGEFRWIEVWARLTLDEKGNATGTAGTLTDITERKRVEEEREKLIHELSDAMSKIKTLSGMLPICASCKKIRDDKGYWNQIESYIKSHSEAEFTHSVCPECAKKLYPD